MNTLQAQIEEPLVECGLLEPSFINSFALNMYHDGSEGKLTSIMQSLILHSVLHRSHGSSCCVPLLCVYQGA